MNVGKNITKFRKEKNLTPEELAQKINISAKAISSYENNRNLPNIETLILLSEVLDVSVDALIGTTKEDKINTKEKYDKQRKNNLLIIFAISLFSLCLFCVHEFMVVGSLVTVSEDLKEYFSIKDVVKLIIQNGLIYLVSVTCIYLIYYFKLNEKKTVQSIIILSIIIITCFAIVFLSIL